VYIQSYVVLGKIRAAVATPAQNVVTASAYDHAAIFHRTSCLTVPGSIGCFDAARILDPVFLKGGVISEPVVDPSTEENAP
jgi:hypothetical protein